MNAYKLEAIVAENGTVILRGLPFRAGDTVEVIVLEHKPTLLSELPAGALHVNEQDYLRGVEAQMDEWASAEDEVAYHDL